MNDHKLAIFMAHYRFGIGRNVPTKYNSKSIIGGNATLKTVRAFLKTEISYANKFLSWYEDIEESMHWWSEYEGIVDDNLDSTLRFIIPIKANETESDYQSRLQSLLASVRAPLVEAGLTTPPTVSPAHARVQAADPPNSEEKQSVNDIGPDNGSENGESKSYSISNEGTFGFDLHLNILEKPKGPKRST